MRNSMKPRRGLSSGMVKTRSFLAWAAIGAAFAHFFFSGGFNLEWWLHFLNGAAACHLAMWGVERLRADHDPRGQSWIARYRRRLRKRARHAETFPKPTSKGFYP